MNKICAHCGRRFTSKFANSTLCYPDCWAKQKRALAEYDGLKSRIRTLEWQLEGAKQSKTTGPLSDEAMKLIKQKCHPDKVQSDMWRKAANEVLAWANKLH